MMSESMLPCPFCGDTPKFPNGNGTQYEIECDCGMARSSVQIGDLMTHDERQSDEFRNYRHKEEFIERARAKAVKYWNTR